MALKTNWIGIDFDGVLNDMYPVRKRIMKEQFGIDLKPEDNYTEAFRAKFGEEKLKTVYQKTIEIIASSPLTLEGELVDGAKEYLDKLYSESFRLFIITSRKDNEAVLAKQFLKMHDMPHRHFIFTSEGSKDEAIQRLNLKVFIDDSYRKLEVIKSRPDLLLLLFDTPSNRSIKISRSDIVRAKGWKDVYKKIKSFQALVLEK